MIGLTNYAKIKNNYCVCYFGYSDEYLVQLRLTKPYMNKAFSGLNIYIGCKDSSISFLDGMEHVLKLTDIKVRKPDFAHIAELRYDGGADHPIERFLRESGITGYPLPHMTIERPTNRFVIIAESTYPTRPLMERQIERLKQHAWERQMEPVVTSDITGAGVVVGVESPGLFLAAAKGLETHLVPTGVGTRLYKKLCPQGNIIEV